MFDFDSFLKAIASMYEKALITLEDKKFLEDFVARLKSIVANDGLEKYFGSDDCRHNDVDGTSFVEKFLKDFVDGLLGSEKVLSFVQRDIGGFPIDSNGMLKGTEGLRGFKGLRALLDFMLENLVDLPPSFLDSLKKTLAAGNYEHLEFNEETDGAVVPRVPSLPEYFSTVSEKFLKPFVADTLERMREFSQLLWAYFDALDKFYGISREPYAVEDAHMAVKDAHTAMMNAVLTGVSVEEIGALATKYVYARDAAAKLEKAEETKNRAAGALGEFLGRKGWGKSGVVPHRCYKCD